MEESQKYDLDKVVRLVITVVSVIGIVLLLNYLSGVLLPFVIGCVLAYALEPAVAWQRRVFGFKSRKLPAIITIVVFFGVLIGSGWLIIPYIVDEFSYMAKLLSAYAKSSFRIPYIPAEVYEFINHYVDFEHMATLLNKEQWMKVAQSVLSGTFTVVGGTMDVLFTAVSWLIVLLYMFFVLIDYDKISRTFRNAVPQRYRATTYQVFEDVEATMSRYFRGQALVSLFVGIIFAIEFQIIGLPLAIVFGLLIGVLNMVPYLQLVTIPIAAFLCLVESVATGGSFWVLFGWTIGAYCLCQLIQDLVLIPIIMKQQMGLNPAIIFLSLSIWSYVLGFIGLIIALPLTTLMLSYYGEYVLGDRYLLTGNRPQAKNKDNNNDK